MHLKNQRLNFEKLVSLRDGNGMAAKTHWERIGNANGIFASLGRMKAGHLTGVGTRHGVIRAEQLFFYLLIANST